MRFVIVIQDSGIFGGVHNFLMQLKHNGLVRLVEPILVEMYSTFRCCVLSVVNHSLPIRKHSGQIRHLSHHFLVNDPSHIVVQSLCESLRKGLNWDTLSRKYDSLAINDPIIENVLLELKEPVEAKKALSFFHWVAHQKKISNGIKSYCITIHILARAGLVNDARGLLQSILMRVEETEDKSFSTNFVVDMLLSTYKATNSCPFVFDLLVQGYSKLGMFDTAFDVCCYLNEHGFSLRLGTLNTLAHSIQKAADGTGLIWKVYEHMIQNRIYPNESTVRIMIDALCKAGELQTFIDMIDRIHGKRCSPLVIVNTSLVYRILKEERIKEGLLILKKMLLKNLILDTISYSLIVYAKLNCGELDSAREIYGEMLSRGFHPNSFVYTMVISAYCKKQMVPKALGLLEEMKNLGLKPYDDTYNSLIMGCAKTGDLENSIRLCEEMTNKGLLPCSSAFNELVQKLCSAGNMKQANAMLTVLIDKGLMRDETTYSYLIDGYGNENKIDEVLKLYYEMEFRSMFPGLPIFTTLIHTLCKCGRLEEADKYLAVMKSRSLGPTTCIYEKLILRHLEVGNKERANQLYNEALQKGLRLSEQISNISV